MKRTLIASAVAITLGTTPIVEANTAGLTGVWTGTYSFAQLGVGGGYNGGSGPGQAWTWRFDNGTVQINNTTTLYGSVWTAHDVTFVDDGTSYGPAGGLGAVNMLFDWSTDLNLPITTSWDVTASGNETGATAIVEINYGYITAASPVFPNFGMSFTGNLNKVVPIPAAGWLMGTGLLGLIAMARRGKT